MRCQSSSEWRGKTYVMPSFMVFSSLFFFPPNICMIRKKLVDVPQLKEEMDIMWGQHHHHISFGIASFSFLLVVTYFWNSFTGSWMCFSFEEETLQSQECDQSPRSFRRWTQVKLCCCMFWFYKWGERFVFLRKAMGSHRKIKKNYKNLLQFPYCPRAGGWWRVIW